LGAHSSLRRLIQYGGVCWTTSELSLSKIKTPTDPSSRAKLTTEQAQSYFAILLTAREQKFSRDIHSLNSSNFCLLDKNFLKNILVAFQYKKLRRITDFG
jgi:hypothetical protein